MAAVIEPGDERDVAEAIAGIATGTAIEIVGGGTKRDIGRPARAVTVLSTAKLNRVIDHDPAELVLTVEPGVRLAEIEPLLASSNQMLAFEPFDFALVTGGELGRSTIGGIVGAGLAGSRRLSAGGVRDHVLGFSAVNGRGEMFKAGGRVVKNVTGYDLSKLVTGSWGQLAMLTRMTLKVLPRPPEARTLVLHGLAASAAQDAMNRAAGSKADVAAASYAPSGAALSMTAFRLEGFGPSIEARTRMLDALLADAGKLETLGEVEARDYWTRVRTASHLSSDLPTLWRISLPPAQGAAVLAGIGRLGGAGVLDWAGALAWVRLPASAAAGEVRALAEAAGGHAMLISAPEDIRLALPALHPEPPAVAALSRRVREAFDPAGIFDPLRFTVGAP